MTQKRGGLRSGARGPLLFLVLQQVGRPVARHPSAVHHLQGGVPTGVVHATQGRVSAEGGHRTIQAKSPACQAVMLLCTSGWRCVGWGGNEKEKRIPTLYRRECSRARIAFSGRTRCRDTSSPAEQRERASVGFLVHLLRICVRFAAYSTILGSILSLFFFVFFLCS